MTAEQVRDVVAAFIEEGDNVTIDYNDSLDTLTISSTGSGGGGGLTSEEVSDLIGAQVLGSSSVTATFSDGSNTVTLTVPTGGITNAMLAGSIALSKLATDPLARANHTGTQTSSTISNFTEAVQDVVGGLLVEGSNITLSYDDSLGTLTINSTGGGSWDAEQTRDTIATALVEGSGIDIAVVDGSDTITITVDPSEFADGSVPISKLAVDVATQAELDAHVTNVNAHAASVIAYNGSTNLSATNVESALDELDTEKVSSSGLTESVQDIVGAYVVAGTGASVVYDDGSGTLTISTTDTGDFLPLTGGDVEATGADRVLLRATDTPDEAYVEVNSDDVTIRANDTVSNDFAAIGVVDTSIATVVQDGATSASTTYEQRYNYIESAVFDANGEKSYFYIDSGYSETSVSDETDDAISVIQVQAGQGDGVIRHTVNDGEGNSTELIQNASVIHLGGPVRIYDVYDMPTTAGASGQALLSEGGDNTDWGDVVHPGDQDASGFDFYINEDDMASSSLTKFPSQRSVKIFVEESVEAGGGYTNENARDTIATALTEGTAIDIDVDDLGDTITISLIPQDIPDNTIPIVALASDVALQEELDEVEATLGTYIDGVLDSLEQHTTSGNAHAASTVGYGGGTGIAATNVEAALDELATEKANSADVVSDGDTAGGVLSGTYPNPGFAEDMATQVELYAHINVASAHHASTVPFAPNGSISATTVQAAIQEVRDEAGAGYTDEEARDAIGTALVAGNAIDIGISDGSDTITIDVDPTEFGNGTIPIAALSVDIATQAELDAHTTNVNAHAASTIAFAPNGSISSTNVQAAIQEVRDEAGGSLADADYGDITVSSSGSVWTIDNGVVTPAKLSFDPATQAELDAVISGATPLSAAVIPITDSANDFTATNVEDALAELQSDNEAHLADTDDAHDASAISYAGSASIVATTVEAAIDELDSEMVRNTGGTLMSVGSIPETIYMRTSSTINTGVFRIDTAVNTSGRHLFGFFGAPVQFMYGNNGDTQPVYQVLGAAAGVSIGMGPGGTTAMDTGIFRSGTAELSVTGTLKVPTAGTASTSVVTNAGVQTLTNKRITNRVSASTTHSSNNLTVETDLWDALTVTALSGNVSTITMNGAPTDFQQFIFRIKDSGSTRTLAWTGTYFYAAGAALPTATTASKILTVGFIYDTVVGKWGCVSVSNEV